MYASQRSELYGTPIKIILTYLFHNSSRCVQCSEYPRQWLDARPHLAQNISSEQGGPGDGCIRACVIDVVERRYVVSISLCMRRPTLSQVVFNSCKSPCGAVTTFQITCNNSTITTLNILEMIWLLVRVRHSVSPVRYPSKLNLSTAHRPPLLRRSLPLLFPRLPLRSKPSPSPPRDRTTKPLLPPPPRSLFPRSGIVFRAVRVPHIQCRRELGCTAENAPRR